MATERYIPAREVRGRYGISDMSVWRWVHDKHLSFPQPIYINRRRFWRLAKL